MGQVYTVSNTNNLESDNFHYTLTSIACPEQYDVYEIGTNDIVAYIRLRNNHLTVECPDCGGDLVFEVDYEEDDYVAKGCFDDETERLETLSKIDDILCKRYQKER